MTDNAANEKKALELLGWERCGCLGHRINLIVKHSLDFPDVSKILFKCRKLLSPFERDTIILCAENCPINSIKNHDQKNFVTLLIKSV